MTRDPLCRRDLASKGRRGRRCAWAACRLGTFHASAEGHRHFAEAVTWFQRAAELGSVQAARIVGFLHLTGTGVYEDRNEAARWFSFAQQPATAAVASDIASVLIDPGLDTSVETDVRGWFQPDAVGGDGRGRLSARSLFRDWLGGRSGRRVRGGVVVERLRGGCPRRNCCSAR